MEDTLKTRFRRLDAPCYRFHSKQSILEVPDLRLCSRVPPEDREDLEVTAKLFYLDKRTGTYPAECIDAAITRLQKLLEVASIDTFIIASDDNLGDNMFSAWQVLENYHEQKSIKKLGVSDLTYEKLDDFMKAVRVKPAINQINVNQWCDIPTKLFDFAKQHEVDLLHNSDKQDILSTETLTKLLRCYGVVDGFTNVAPSWVLKYHVFVNNRSVVTDKG
ncbi:hypothetical protein DFQ30_006463 [Apophysomyces sp. BC1015]